MIDRLNPISQVNPPTPQRIRPGKAVPPTEDIIDLSAEALAKAERYYLDKVASETPDVRTALVEEVKEKIKNPAYINQAVLDSVADKLLDTWL
jgi:negative regulator of flagellin synthesis FlgM